MLMLIKQRILVITPPKCGSTSAHERWTQCDVGARFVIGPQMDGEIDKHTTSVPFDAREFRRVCLIRNPHDRAWSLWTHYLRWDGPIGLAEFQELLTSGECPFNRPVTELVADVRIDEFWPIEMIDKIASQNGLPGLPVLNQSSRPSNRGHSPILNDWADVDLATWRDAIGRQ